MHPNYFVVISQLYFSLNRLKRKSFTKFKTFLIISLLYRVEKYWKINYQKSLLEFLKCLFFVILQLHLLNLSCICNIYELITRYKFKELGFYYLHYTHDKKKWIIRVVYIYIYIYSFYINIDYVICGLYKKMLIPPNLNTNRKVL